MDDSDWDIRREGRAWQRGEAMQRYELTPEKLGMFEGSSSGTRRTASISSGSCWIMSALHSPKQRKLQRSVALPHGSTLFPARLEHHALVVVAKDFFESTPLLGHPGGASLRHARAMAPPATPRFPADDFLRLGVDLRLNVDK